MLIVKRIAITMIIISATGTLVFSYLGRQSTKSVGPTALQKVRRSQAQVLQIEADKAWHQGNDLDKAEKLIRQSLQVDPQDIFAKSILAEILVEQGKSKEALVVYHDLLHPNVPTNSGFEIDPLTLGRYSELCREARLSSEATWAERQIVLTAWRSYHSFPEIKASELKSYSVTEMAQLAQGLAWQQKGDDKTAYLLFSRVTKDQPNLALAHLYLGRSLERTKGFGVAEAKQEYTKASRLGRGEVKAAALRELR